MKGFLDLILILGFTSLISPVAFKSFSHWKSVIIRICIFLSLFSDQNTFARSFGRSYTVLVNFVQAYSCTKEVYWSCCVLYLFTLKSFGNLAVSINVLIPERLDNILNDLKYYFGLEEILLTIWLKISHFPKLSYFKARFVNLWTNNINKPDGKTCPRMLYPDLH